ncbi:imm11 family protein [Pyxidicoccus sp. 3LG]
MLRRFFELFDDVYVPSRWHLTGPVDAQGQELDDPWQFTGGHSVEKPGQLWMKYDVPGSPLDYSHGGLNVPIVHARVAKVFTELAPQDVQLIPVQVEDQTDPYFILVVTRLVRCIDEETSRIRRWTPEDGLPEKVGQYKSIENLHVDKARVGDARVFRPEGWKVDIIVSEELKEALERIRATGVTFTEVP